VISVERRDDLQICCDRLEFAKLDCSFSQPQSLHEARDLHLRERRGPVEPPFGKYAVNFPPTIIYYSVLRK
jgi:hypothetical protein